MYRKPTVIDPALQALIDERDDLKIRLHLAAERSADDDANDLQAMRARLLTLDKEIARLWSGKRGT